MLNVTGSPPPAGGAAAGAAGGAAAGCGVPRASALPRPVPQGPPAPAAGAAGCGRGGAGRRAAGAAGRGRGTFVERQDDLADGDLVAALDLDLGDRAGHRRRHFDGRLVGLELEDGLILGDRVADLDEDVQHVAALDAVPEVGNLEFGGHVATKPPGSSSPG